MPMGLFLGPPFGTGSLPLSDEQTLTNLNKHLLQGTTTILNVDGFATMDQVNSTRARHPMRIETSTIHTPLNIKAAYASDGQGMLPQNKEPTAKGMLEEGAIALAEVGDGGTLGGAGQDYIFIPRAVKKATGIDISTAQARALKFAVLGKHIDPSQFDEDSVFKLCQQFGLQDHINVSGIKALIENTVLPPFKIAVDGMIEAGRFAQRYRVPVMVHHASASLKVVREMAHLGQLLVAGHSNHPSFGLEECLEACRYLREHGVIIDVSTLDTFGARQLVDSPENLYALVREGIADTMSTDYGGGAHDALTLCIEHLVKDGICTLQRAVSMVTGNVASLIPGLASQRGTLKQGKIADIVIVEQDDMSVVNKVIIGGRMVVDHGKLVFG